MDIYIYYQSLWQPRSFYVENFLKLSENAYFLWGILSVLVEIAH